MAAIDSGPAVRKCQAGAVSRFPYRATISFFLAAASAAVSCGSKETTTTS